jgi:hypothetical protein
MEIAKPRHAAQARLCPDCEQGLRRAAERHDGFGGKFQFCPLTGALAVVIIRDRAIISWSLEGPMSEFEATAIAVDGLQDLLLRWEAEQRPFH